MDRADECVGADGLLRERLPRILVMVGWYTALLFAGLFLLANSDFHPETTYAVGLTVGVVVVTPVVRRLKTW